MNLAQEHRADFDAMPAVLRALLEAELGAGNTIVEVGHSSPAPPAGAYFKLAIPISTRRRNSGDGIDFYDRNSSMYSGEFTDAKRFYFILEPPHPAEPEPDMDAIREASCAKQDNMPRPAEDRPVRDPHEVSTTFLKQHFPDAAAKPAPAPRPETAVDRFRESMVMNYERWHDGIGYDLKILKTAAPDELVEIENLLIENGVSDWRDVEALATMDSPRARALLRKTLKTGSREHASAVTRFAPHLVKEEEHVATLVAALEETDFYAGLTQALLQVQSFHPPEVIAALLRGVLKREGGHACHFAAMLMFLHGKAASAFDWEHRPFYLKFNTEDRVHREAMFRELCGRIGVNPGEYLDTK
jgi:hypothetical protein